MVTLRDTALLAGAVYGAPDRRGAWRRAATLDGTGRGFCAQLWVKDFTGAGVLTIRGTAGLGEAKQDAALLLGHEPRAWRRGRAAVAHARRIIGARARLCLTGHSIGGAYASALGAEHRIPTVTFNAPGMLAALRRGHRSLGVEPGWISAANPHVMNICIAGDWIRHLSGPGIGTDVVLGHGLHSPCSFGRGLPGLVAALAHGRRVDGGLRRFVPRSLQRHSLRAFAPLLRHATTFPWDDSVTAFAPQGPTPTRKVTSTNMPLLPVDPQLAPLSVGERERRRSAIE